MFQNDNAWQFNANVTPGNTGQQPGTAQWYSFVNYLFWEFTPEWQGAVRLEYFRDNNGYIVSAPLRNESQLGNPGYWTGGFADNFWRWPPPRHVKKPLEDLTVDDNERPRVDSPGSVTFVRSSQMPSGVLHTSCFLPPKSLSGVSHAPRPTGKVHQARLHAC
ncbi:MAG: outer membrane beta-barrel protein [Planctomycetota bacterium]|nr:outer membrane beta-barrel protein [Planctomycetota bacterium]